MAFKKKQDVATSQPDTAVPAAGEPSPAADIPEKGVLEGNPVRAVNKLGLKHSVYVADHTSGEMVPADEEADAPAPKMEKCKCGQLWDTNAIKEGLCPRCRAFAAMDEKIGNSGEMRYIKRGPDGIMTTVDDPKEASRPRF